MSSGITWVPLLLLAGLIGLVVWALASGHWKVLLGVVAVLVLGFLVLFAAPVSVRRSQTTALPTVQAGTETEVARVELGHDSRAVARVEAGHDSMAVARVQAGHDLGPLQWESPARLGFEANVFPSKRAAAEFLTDRLLRDPSLESSSAGSPDRVYLTALTPEVEQVMGEVVRRVHPKAELVLGSAPNPPVDGEGSWLELFQTDRTETLVDLNVRWRAGGRAQMATGYAQVQAKGWVDNLAAYAAERRVEPGDFMVVYSNETANGLAAAEQQATRLAGEALRPYLIARDPQAVGVDAQRLTVPSVVKDRFTQHLRTPSGQQVTRVALLIDRSEAALQQLTRECQLQARVARARQLSETRFEVGKWAAVGVLAVFVMALGLGVNAITRGYYRGAVLGVAMLAIVALGVLAKFSGLIIPHG